MRSFLTAMLASSPAFTKILHVLHDHGAKLLVEVHGWHQGRADAVDKVMPSIDEVEANIGLTLSSETLPPLDGINSSTVARVAFSGSSYRYCSS